MRRKNITIIGITIALIGIVLAQAAVAAGQSYVDKRRMITVGVLDMSYQKWQTGLFVPFPVPPAAPYVFFIMGQREDMKPQGWTFVNPLAGGTDAYKNTAAYWIVPLAQTTIENLAKFDVLYMSAKQPDVVFPMSERDKLRRFVDGGGCLWVDNGGGMSFSTETAEAFFLPGVNFTVGGGTNPTLLTRLHPLVTSPFWLAPNEVTSLGNAGATVEPGFKKDFSEPPSPTILSPITLVDTGGLNGLMPTIAAIEYGSGRVVFTSGFVGGRIQGPVSGWTAQPALTSQNSNLLMADPAAMRFAYNVVGWATASTTLRKNYRRAGVSLDGMGAPLVNKWEMPATAVGGGKTEISPAVWKNVIFYSAGSTLYAVDAAPEQDLDMDGSPDDGQPDGPNPAYDIVWKANIGVNISSPTVASMLDPEDGTLVPRDFVLVTGADDMVYVYEALPQAADGRMSGAPVGRPDLWPIPAGAESGGALLPPVVQNGWIYAVGGDGKIYGHSPVLAASGAPSASWSCPLIVTTVPTVQADIKYGPTFGFIKNKTTGAVVQMLSVIARPPTPPGPSVVAGDTVYTLPVFVSSDLLRPVTDMTTNPVIFRPTFGSQISGSVLPISDYPEPEIWAVDTSGNPVSITSFDYTTTPGKVSVTGNLGPNVKVYMTYAVDYSKVNIPPVMNYSPPSYAIPPTMAVTPGAPQLIPEATGTPALGPNDSFYTGIRWDGATGTGKSSVYSMWYDGRTGILKWNYFLHGGWEVREAKGDDQLWGIYVHMPDGEVKPVQKLEVVGTPAVMNDRVFVTARTSDPGTAGVSKGYLLCFKSDPNFVIRVHRSMKEDATGRHLTIKLWQPDLLYGTGYSAQPLLTAAPVPRDMIDYDSGAITITDFARIRQQAIVGSVTVPAGTITPSLPVWVYIDNSPVPPEELDLSSWDNLLWSFAIPAHGAVPCSGVSSSPIVLGDYVYFTCDDGYIYAVSVDASPKDKVLDSTDTDNWDTWVPMREQIKIGASGTSANVSLAGAGGVLAVPGAQGLYGFANKTTLVTDNHRVLEIGDDGKVYWACDSVFEPKPAYGVKVVAPETAYGIQSQSLNKPFVAQKFSPSDYLVVESGNDRIIRIDRGGQILWSLKKFDDSYKNLLRSGEPKTLKSPVDARTWGEFDKDADGNWFYVSHCIVVDSGNFRILDIVDRFNANDKWQILEPVNPDDDGRPIHELNWVSDTSYREKRLSFSSVQVVGGFQIWASVANFGLIGDASPQTVGGGHLGGAIVRMTYRENVAPYQWNYLDGVIDAQLTSLLRGATPVALSGPTFFEVRDPTSPRLLICDSSAVYLTDGPNGQIDWEFTAADYGSITRKIMTKDATTAYSLKIPFNPQRAQVLPGGDRVLIVNSYAGRVQDPAHPEMLKFVGEVFEIDRASTQIYWYSPDIHEITDAGGAVTAIVQKMKNAPNLDQPTSVQRLF